MSKPSAPFPMMLRLSDDSGMTEVLTAEEMYEKREAILEALEFMRSQYGEDGFSIYPWVVAMTRFAQQWEADEISE